MKIAYLVSVLVVVLVTSCVTTTPLEGTWNCVSATVDGKSLSDTTAGRLRLTLTSSRYKTERGAEVLFDSTYTTDPSKSPKHIDMVGTEGDLTGKKAQGIYAVRDDILKVCYTIPGKPRPIAFDSSPGSEAYLLIWKRQLR